MKNDWRERKGLIVGLGVLAALVWGYNVLLVTGGGAPPTPASVASAPTSITGTGAGPHPAGGDPYVGDFADPFEPRLAYASAAFQRRSGVVAGTVGPVPEASSASSADPYAETPPEPEWYAPPLVLRGIVGPAAVLEDAAGAVHFARPGARVGDAVVRSVAGDSAVVVVGRRSHVLRLSG